MYFFPVFSLLYCSSNVLYIKKVYFIALVTTYDSLSMCLTLTELKQFMN